MKGERAKRIGFWSAIERLFCLDVMEECDSRIASLFLFFTGVVRLCYSSGNRDKKISISQDGWCLLWILLGFPHRGKGAKHREHMFVPPWSVCVAPTTSPKLAHFCRLTMYIAEGHLQRFFFKIIALGLEVWQSKNSPASWLFRKGAKLSIPKYGLIVTERTFQWS